MMNNYAEAKKELTNIRNKYSCAGDLLFRTFNHNHVGNGGCGKGSRRRRNS